MEDPGRQEEEMQSCKNQVGCGKHMLNAIIRGMCGRGLGKISIRPQVSWGSVTMGMSPSEIARLRAHEAR